jgi:hypothetical protein
MVMIIFSLKKKMCNLQYQFNGRTDIIDIQASSGAELLSLE